MPANQSQAKDQMELASAGSLVNVTPPKLPSNVPFWGMDWTPGSQLLVVQGPEIRLVNPAGGNRVVFSEPKFPMDQVVSCGQGRYVVFRTLGRSGGAEANFWRIDLNGTNLKRLTFCVNERLPACSNDRKWLYSVDVAANQFLKRISIECGPPETIVRSPPIPYNLSPDGKTIPTFEERALH